jgi:hypothetical protein
MNDYATYSPQDNKLRLYPAARLDEETYKAVKDQGFIWAAKQGCFVAPMWTPQREDFLLTMVDAIDDEDSTMEERAEQRAERFQAYSGKRAADAERAYNAVQAISDAIPFGQPILVGHHSQRKAEKDAQRIENGMRKTVKMWETSEYWKDRAAASIRHARYKERNDVRWRRRKGLEADARKYQRDIDDCRKRLDVIAHPDMNTVRLIACYKKGVFNDYQSRYVKYNYETQEYTLVGTLEEVIERMTNSLKGTIAHYTRWLDHTNNRIAYETAMLQGWEPEKIERKKPDLSPLCNFETPECVKMTAAEWKRASRCADAYFVQPFEADGTKSAWRAKGHYRQRVQSQGFTKPPKVVFITDMPVKMPPAVETVEGVADAG